MRPAVSGLWKRTGTIGIVLLVAAIATAATGYLTRGAMGANPEDYYRIAVYLVAGAVLMGIGWLTQLDGSRRSERTR